MRSSKMPNKDLQKVPVEGRKLVRDMRSKAILSRDTTSREAYLKRKNFRVKKDNEIVNLRRSRDDQKSEIADLKDQIANLAKMMEKLAKPKRVTKKDKDE